MKKIWDFWRKIWGFWEKFGVFKKKKLGFLGLEGDYMVDDHNDMEFGDGKKKKKKKKCYGWYGIRINSGITSKCVSKVQSQYKK